MTKFVNSYHTMLPEFHNALHILQAPPLTVSCLISTKGKHCNKTHIPTYTIQQSVTPILCSLFQENPGKLVPEK